MSCDAMAIIQVRFSDFTSISRTIGALVWQESQLFLSSIPWQHSIRVRLNIPAPAAERGSEKPMVCTLDLFMLLI